MRTDPLVTYLNDHLAGATLAVELMKRSAGSNGGEPLGTFLRELLATVEDERGLVENLVLRAGGRPNRLKVAGAWASEKLGRVKLNRRLFTYSDLSRLEEVEGLLLGVRGKLALWETMQAVAEADPRFGGVDFEALARRAERQIADLERHRRDAFRRAFLD